MQYRSGPTDNTTARIAGFLRSEWLYIVLLAFPFVLTAMVWDRLPDRRPFRWLPSEDAESGQRGHEVLFMPLVNVAVWAFLLALPRLHVRLRGVAEYPNLYNTLRLVVVLFLTVLNCAALFEAVGYAVSMPSVFLYLTLSTALLVSSSVRTLPPDYPAGIRTPWTVGNTEVWTRTHQWTGTLWLVLSLSTAAVSLVVPPTLHMYLLLIFLCSATIGPVAYSYLIRSRTE